MWRPDGGLGRCRPDGQLRSARASSDGSGVSASSDAPGLSDGPADALADGSVEARLARRGRWRGARRRATAPRLGRPRSARRTAGVRSSGRMSSRRSMTAVEQAATRAPIAIRPAREVRVRRAFIAPSYRNRAARDCLRCADADRLAGPRPGPGPRVRLRPARDDRDRRGAANLRRADGIDRLVLFVEDHELAYAGVSNIEATLAAEGIELVRHPVPDMGVPRDPLGLPGSARRDGCGDRCRSDGRHRVLRWLRADGDRRVVPAHRCRPHRRRGDRADPRDRAHGTIETS